MTAMKRRAFLLGVTGSATAAILAACGGETATLAPTTAPTATRPAATTAPMTAPTTAAAASPAAATTAPTAAAATTAPTTAATTAATAAATTAPTAAATVAPAATTAPTAAAMAPAGTMAAAPLPTGVSGLVEGTPVGMVSTNSTAVPNLTGKLALKSIYFAFVPGDDPSTFFMKNNDLFAYMKQALGVNVVGSVGANYTAVITAMGAKKVELASFGPFSYILAHENANAQCFLTGETKDGKLATYNSYIIAPADSPITKLEDIRGKNFSFVDAASTSGHLVPSYTLLMKAGLKEMTDFKTIYAGSHPASYEAVANKKVDAGAIASDIFASGIADGSIDMKKVKIIDTSFDIPGSPIAVRGDISGADQEVLLQMFLAINNRPTDDKLFQSFVVRGGFGTGTVKIRKGDDSLYNDLRKIPAAIGVDITKLK